ncbi:putative C-terminal motor kinesin [Trypanosoma grayi]|uniref:putative C-terminal motor kinesin n=1 Tax=Trypanosoma grayi TaxID=71804 RepID=UPI0004F42D02|nr:putative C-terminal motor kinesin [Trypanosoma grayi]KEG13854.1 putative C-terminal motor kinesin [Trypanosoma grayi]
MPSQVNIVVRTRPTDFVADSFQVASTNTLRFMRTPPTSSPTAEAMGAAHARPGANTGGAEEPLTFTADAVLHNTSQETVYNMTTSDLVEVALQGINCTLLCYGQSGSGKSYTLFGGDTFPTRGCVPRAIQSLFDSIRMSSERETKVSLTFVEVYGEQVYDLLGKGPSAAVALAAAAKADGRSGNANKACVTIDSNGAVLLRGVEERRCATEAEALTTLFEGLQRRLSGANALNPQSSRSHVVLTFYLESKSLLDSDALTHHSRLNFVDLAGSERPHAHADEAAQQENKMINRSLMMLEQVILALAGHRPRHVPYRQSKLTMLLKDSIGGNSRTTLIANVWPEQRHMDASLATLNFAKRMVRVESNPSVHATMDPQAHIKMLQKQVSSLKSELRMQDQLAGREAIATAPLESDEIQTARERVIAFVDGTAAQVRVTCVREMHACFLAFRTILEEQDAQMKEMERLLAATSRPGSASSTKGSSKRKCSSRHQAASEPREQVRFISSVPDANTGVGVGTTEKPSPGLREMFQQQQQQSRGTANSLGYAPNGAGVGKGANEYASALASPAEASATSGKPPPPPVPALTMIPEEDPSKTRSRLRRPSSCPVEDKHEAILPPTDRFVATMALTSLNAPGRQEGVVRDRRAAFEAYKRTPTGNCQMVAINNAQKLLSEKNDTVIQLQRRLKEINADIEACKRSEGPTATLEERVAARCTPIEMHRSSVVFSESYASFNENNMTSGEGSPTIHAGDLSSMTVPDKKALLHHTKSAVTRAITERGICAKQLNRHREALMSNFQYWYHSNLQPSLAPQGEKVVTPAAAAAAAAAAADGKVLPTLRAAGLHSPGHPRVKIAAEGDTRFMDGGERFEASEMQRLLQKDPEGVTFYAAQRLVRSGLALHE